MALVEYSQMSTHVPGFQSFFRFLHHFVLAKSASSSVRVKHNLYVLLTKAMNDLKRIKEVLCTAISFSNIIQNINLLSINFYLYQTSCFHSRCECFYPIYTRTIHLNWLDSGKPSSLGDPFHLVTPTGMSYHFLLIKRTCPNKRTRPIFHG